jgi:hypothetical protein
MFSATASGNGVVEYLSKDVIRVKYEDGTVAAHQIGRRYGKWSGKVIPHSLKTDLKVGDSVKENDILFYNELFFTKDPFGDDIALKWGVLARVAFIENRETLEDGSGISADFAKKLTTTDCKPKYIQVNFDEEVRNLLPVGSKIDDESILCTIMPPSTAALSQFADDAADVLRRVKHDSPRGKFNGVIERYRVYYCGDISEMSPSLALLTEQSNDEILALARKMKEPAVDGMVPLGNRVDGHPIAKNTAIIEVSMLGELGMKPGDKVSIGGQMKSIVGETYGEMEYEGDQTVFEETPISEDGQPLDVIFAQTGSFNRMINSAQLSGGINTCMIHIGINMANIFFGDEG